MSFALYVFTFPYDALHFFPCCVRDDPPVGSKVKELTDGSVLVRQLLPAESRRPSPLCVGSGTKVNLSY